MTARKLWNRMAEMIAALDTLGTVEDMGQSGSIKNNKRYHKFFFLGYQFKVTLEDDVPESNQE